MLGEYGLHAFFRYAALPCDLDGAPVFMLAPRIDDLLVDQIARYVGLRIDRTVLSIRRHAIGQVTGNLRLLIVRSAALW